MALTELKPSPDYEKVVETCGGKGEKVEGPQNLLPALRRAHAHLEIYSGLPNYRNSWLRQGFDESDLVRGGSERLADALVAHGDISTNAFYVPDWVVVASATAIAPLTSSRPVQ